MGCVCVSIMYGFVYVSSHLCQYHVWVCVCVSSQYGFGYVSVVMYGFCVCVS